MSNKWDEEMEGVIQKECDDTIKSIGKSLDEEIEKLINKKEMDTPILKSIAEMSTYKDGELRFIKLTKEGLNDLLNELDKAKSLAIRGELLGVSIEVDD